MFAFSTDANTTNSRLWSITDTSQKGIPSLPDSLSGSVHDVSEQVSTMSPVYTGPLAGGPTFAEGEARQLIRGGVTSLGVHAARWLPLPEYRCRFAAAICRPSRKGRAGSLLL